MRRRGMCSGVLPLVFILLNLFITPRYQITLRTGGVLAGLHIVMNIALLFLLFMFNAIFLLMATSLNRNAKLQQENQLLSMQQQRYESLKTAIEEARQARHDMRHQLNQSPHWAETGDLGRPESLPCKNCRPDPGSGYGFCENRAADSVVGYYCALAKREGIPFCARLDLPQVLPVDEIDMCLVLSKSSGKCIRSQPSHCTPPGGRSRSPRMSMPSGFFWSKWKTHLTVQSTKKAGCSALPSEGKTGSASSLSAILQKRPAGASTIYPSEWRFLSQGHALRIRSLLLWRGFLCPIFYKKFTLAGLPPHTGCAMMKCKILSGAMDFDLSSSRNQEELPMPERIMYAGNSEHHSQRSAQGKSWPKNCLITMKRIWRMRCRRQTPAERQSLYFYSGCGYRCRDLYLSGRCRAVSEGAAQP